MATAGPNSPGTLANDATFGVNSWSNVANAGASDDVYATSSSMSGQSTNYLKATNFGFAIDAGATINGITVGIEKKCSAGADTTDSRVRIVKGGTIGATERASGVAWGTTDAYTTYGGSSDLWGETWTPADINATTFGVVIAGSSSNAMSRQLSVDHIRITVDYSLPGGNPSKLSGKLSSSQLSGKLG